MAAFTGIRIFIPKDDDNADYQTYLSWLDAGNLIEAESPEAVRIRELAAAKESVAYEIVNKYQIHRQLNELSEAVKAISEALVTISGKSEPVAKLPVADCIAKLRDELSTLKDKINAER